MAAVEAQARGDRGVCPGSGKPRLQEEGLTVADPLERRLCLSERARAAQETRLAAGRVERELATVRAYLAGDGPPGIQPVPRGRHLCSTGRCGRCWLWRPPISRSTGGGWRARVILPAWQRTGLTWTGSRACSATPTSAPCPRGGHAASQPAIRCRSRMMWWWSGGTRGRGGGGPRWRRGWRRGLAGAGGVRTADLRL